MKKIVLAAFAIVILAMPAYAQRSVNSAQDAAKAAKASLVNQSGGSSSQIEWLDQVIDVVNNKK